MTRFHKILTAACLSSAAFVPGLAHADDAPPAVKAFLDNLQRQTAAKPAYEALKSDGSGNVTITNLTLTKDAQGDAPGFTSKTAEVSFSGIADQGNSLWLIGKASFTNTTLQMTGKDAALSASIPGASAEGWYIRAVPAAPSPKEELLSASTFAKSMTSGPVSITAAGQTLKIDSVDTAWTGDATTGAGKFTMKVNNLAIPESAMALVDQGGVMKQLGYTGLNLDIGTAGDLAVNGDDLNLGFDFSFAGRGIGALAVNANVNDLPVAAYAQMLKDQASGKGIDFDKLSPQLQDVQVNGLSLTFTDDSIVKKALPLAAAMQGMDEKTFVASIPPMLQLTLIQLQNEALTKQAVEAVTAFLAAPKSLTVSAKPASPMKVSDFGKLDPAKPGDAISKLGITVTAND